MWVIRRSRPHKASRHRHNKRCSHKYHRDVCVYYTLFRLAISKWVPRNPLEKSPGFLYNTKVFVIIEITASSICNDLISVSIKIKQYLMGVPSLWPLEHPWKKNNKIAPFANEMNSECFQCSYRSKQIQLRIQLFAVGSIGCHGATKQVWNALTRHSFRWRLAADLRARAILRQLWTTQFTIHL